LLDVLLGSFTVGVGPSCPEAAAAEALRRKAAVVKSKRRRRGIESNAALFARSSAPSVQPTSLIAANEAAEFIFRCMRALPEFQYRALRLRGVSGLTLETIASQIVGATGASAVEATRRTIGSAVETLRRQVRVRRRERESGELKAVADALRRMFFALDASNGEPTAETAEGA
jgi:hypothetical protein